MKTSPIGLIKKAGYLNVRTKTKKIIAMSEIDMLIPKSKRNDVRVNGRIEKK